MNFLAFVNIMVAIFAFWWLQSDGKTLPRLKLAIILSYKQENDFTKSVPKDHTTWRSISTMQSFACLLEVDLLEKKETY